MAVKRIREHEEVETMERLRKEEVETIVTDRLTDLPEPLQLHILSSLETRDAIQTLMVWKSLVSSWTRIPVLNFNSYAFHKLFAFDKFVYMALSLRGSAKLEKLTFERGGSCRAKILTEVFDYAFSHGIKELEVNISHGGKDIIHGGKDREWPIWMHVSSDSLTSFKLGSSRIDMHCWLWGPRSGSFKNLTNLHLKRVIITDVDPFSGYVALDKLSLVGCPLHTNGNVLNVHALRLSVLTISNNDQQHVNCCVLTTPKLRYFEYQGINFPQLTAHRGGLPVLETVVVGYNGFCLQNHEKIMLDDVLMMFNVLRHAKSLTVFSSIVRLLSLFPDELVNLPSPFRDVKCLKLDLSFFFTQHLIEGVPNKIRSEFMRPVTGVKAYLLQNSHAARCTMIYPS